MRILHITSPKSWRGGEQQLMYLVEELNAMGVDQWVMCPFNSAVHAYCLKNHVRHITYFKAFSANPMVGFKVKQISTEHNIDLIHAHDSHAHNFAVLSATLADNNKPIVVSRRVDFAPQGNVMSRFKYNYDHIKGILCVSRAILEIMTPYIEDKKKLSVVYSGIDTSKFATTKGHRLRTEFAVPNDHIPIGNVAALAPHKDYPTFVRAARNLIDSGLKATFIAIGEGPSRKEAEQAIQDMDMAKHMILAGFRSDVPEVLSELDVFMMTSKTEGLGTSVLDAMAAGVPVVACEAGGVGEIITHEINGLLCAVGDDRAISEQVLRLLSDNQLLQRCIEGGQARVQDFTKAAMAAGTLAIYREILDV